MNATAGQSEKSAPSLREQIVTATNAVESLAAAETPSTSSTPAPSTPATDNSQASAPATATPEASPDGSSATPEGKTTDGSAQPAAELGAKPSAPLADPDAKMPSGFPGGEATWKALPPEQRAWVKKRELDIQSFVDKGSQAMKFGGAMWGAVRPYEAMMRARGEHPATVVGHMLDQHFRLTQGTDAQKGAVIQGLMQHYGVNPDSVGVQEQDAPQDTGTADPIARQALAQLVQYMRGQAEQNQQGMLADANTRIDSFEKDPQYAHAKDPAIRAAMADWLESGRAQDLPHAYSMAVWNVPHVRNAMLEKMGRDAAEKARQELSAAPATGGAPVASRQIPNDESLRGTIARQMESWTG